MNTTYTGKNKFIRLALDKFSFLGSLGFVPKVDQDITSEENFWSDLVFFVSQNVAIRLQRDVRDGGIFLSISDMPRSTDPLAFFRYADIRYLLEAKNIKVDLIGPRVKTEEKEIEALEQYTLFLKQYCNDILNGSPHIIEHALHLQYPDSNDAEDELIIDINKLTKK